MLPFKRILFPVDYGAPCKATVPFVQEALSHFKAQLTLVHGYGPDSLAFSDLALSDPDLPAEVQAIEEKRMKQFAAEEFPSEHAETFVKNEDASVLIHSVLAKQGADLVMMPTQGRSAIRRFLLGSVTAKVLHDSTVAVWTGTSAALEAHRPGLPNKSVLCALSETEEATAILMAAAAIAKSYGARLSIVHVVETPPAASEIDYGSFEKAITDAADVRIRELKSELGITAPHAVLSGGVADTVRHQALHDKAGLVVVGRGHAQGALSRVWSNLYAIVRDSPCPVLSI
jgi:nucleotide-binding universal stress UspA family protein